MIADIVVAAMPYSMGVAVVGAAAIGWLVKPITLRTYREKVRRLSRSVRVLTEQLDTAEYELVEERALVNALAEDLTETRRALRAATADPHLASPRHMTIEHMRQVAARPLPGESTGAHAATTEGDRP